MGLTNQTVRLRLPEVAARSSRIELSAGTGPAEESGAVGYESGALIARPPWRMPRPDEARRFICGEKVQPDPQREVAVLGFDAQLVQAANAGGPQQALAAIRPEVLGRIDWLRPPACDGISHQQPGLPTVTRDLAGHALIGLHIDMWDGFPIQSRHRSRLRFDLNLGPEPRHFIFIPYTVQAIAEQCGQLPDGRDDAAMQGLARQFLHLHPLLPAVRVRIDPGQAYLAPTENLIHDASSECATRPARHVSFRGFVGSPADRST